MRVRQYEPNQCIGIGDSIEDLEVASAVGRFFVVANGPRRDPGLGEAISAYSNVTVTEGSMGEGFYEAVVRSLSIAMHSDRQLVIPLLQLKEFDQYTTTHSMNVAVLTMALAEHLGLGARDVRSFGIAGLLHDIGKVTIPLDVLTKPGRFTDEERALMNQHPVEGARIILKSHEQLELPASGPFLDEFRKTALPPRYQWQTVDDKWAAMVGKGVPPPGGILR